MCRDYFIAPVFIDERGPYPFILDSGAGTSVVDPAIARELRLDDRMDFRVGDFSVEGAELYRSSMTDIGRVLGRDVAGILGHEVFQDYLLTYDYAADAILLNEGSLAESDPGVVRTADRDRPWVAAMVDGRRIAVLIDTGAGRGLTLRDLEGFTLTDPPAVTGGSMRINGLHLVESGRLEGVADFGPMVLESPIAHESVSVNLIGQSALSNYRLTFDQKNDLMRFDRIDGDGSPIPSGPVVGTGVVVAPVEDSWQVVHVDADTEFDGPALARGDTITAVDGIPMAERVCWVPDYSARQREWTDYQITRLTDPVRARRRILVR
jgi:hypothetical protein